jgi:hypothetical protein
MPHCHPKTIVVSTVEKVDNSKSVGSPLFSWKPASHELKIIAATRKIISLTFIPIKAIKTRKIKTNKIRVMIGEFNLTDFILEYSDLLVLIIFIEYHL